MNDKLREALDELGSCQDDYNYLIGITENKNNLHGWLRIRVARVAKIREALAASKQEPQAQAEPEVVAWIDNQGFPHHKSHFQPLADMRNGKWKPLITLQSHREAIAAYQTKYELTAELLHEKREAIAKKDAALKEIVSKGSQTGYGKMALVLIAKAAIAQAREARK